MYPTHQLDPVGPPRKPRVRRENGEDVRSGGAQLLRNLVYPTVKGNHSSVGQEHLRVPQAHTREGVCMCCCCFAAVATSTAAAFRHMSLTSAWFRFRPDDDPFVVGEKNGFPGFSELLNRCTSAPDNSVSNATESTTALPLPLPLSLLPLLSLLLLLAGAAGPAPNAWSPMSV